MSLGEDTDTIMLVLFLIDLYSKQLRMMISRKGIILSRTDMTVDTCQVQIFIFNY